MTEKGLGMHAGGLPRGADREAIWGRGAREDSASRRMLNACEKGPSRGHERHNSAEAVVGWREQF